MKEEKKIRQVLDLTDEELQKVQGGVELSSQTLLALQQSSLNITHTELRKMQINTDFMESLDLTTAKRGEHQQQQQQQQHNLASF